MGAFCDILLKASICKVHATILHILNIGNYTTRGLAKICKEGVDAIGSALRELETAGYIVRNQLRDQQGRISDTEYVIYEKPQPRQPETPRPDTAVPDTASPDTENPYLDKPDSMS